MNGKVIRIRAENVKLSGALSKLRVEHQAVKDELARLKNLPPRTPQKPSGMDKATDRPDSQANGCMGGLSKIPLFAYLGTRLAIQGPLILLCHDDRR